MGSQGACLSFSFSFLALVLGLTLGARVSHAAVYCSVGFAAGAANSCTVSSALQRRAAVLPHALQNIGGAVLLAPLLAGSYSE